MADDRYGYWVHEYGRTSRAPSVGATLVLFAVLTVVLLSLLGGPEAYAEHVEQGNRHKPPTLCEEHKGRPGWDYVCRPKQERVSSKR